MTRTDIADFIRREKIIAVVRLSSGAQLAGVAAALLAGGVRIIEFTLTTPNALEGIAACAAEHGDVLVGAGSVLDEAMTHAAIKAGAAFVVSPVRVPGMIEAAHAHDRAVMPGAYTPTEIFETAASGADFVKVFPANTLGPAYLKAVRAPMPHLEMVPTGGVTVENTAAFLKAGAAAVGVGGELVPGAAVDAGNFAEITERAKAFVEAARA